jgi:hypothetical protein
VQRAWRFLISLMAACAYGGLSVTVLEDAHMLVAAWIRSVISGTFGFGISVAFAWFAPIVLLALAINELLARLWRPKEPDAETRCRECGFILRGISEPRCPECGERI